MRRPTKVAEGKIWILKASPLGRLLDIGAWVLVGVLTASLLWLSLNACSLAGLFPGSGLGFCQANVNIELTEEDSQRLRLDVLQQEIQGLEQAIALSPVCESSVLGELNCPAQNPSEIALVLDRSASMSLCAELSEEQSNRVRELYDSAYTAREAGRVADANRLVGQAQEIERSVNCPSPNRRIDTAMSAIQTFAEQGFDASRITVTSLGTCESPTTVIGEYDSGDTGDLISRLRRLGSEDLEDRTPLAATIRNLIDRIDGGETPEDHVTVIMISDGQDSCSADPCAAARAFHEAKPHAVINVITVGGDPYVGFCIAQATGGNVYDGRDAANLPRALQQASGEQLPDGCR